jgi:hypothetical protein
MFTNVTTVPGLEQLITKAVRTQLQQDGRVSLGTEASSTAELRGEVIRFGMAVLATDPSDFVLEYRAEVEIRVKVEDLRQRQTMLDQRLIINTDYVVSSPQIVPNEVARQRAMLAVAREAGERVVSLLLERF